MKKIITVLISLVFVFQAFSQIRNYNSLNAEIKNRSEFYLKVNLDENQDVNQQIAKLNTVGSIDRAKSNESTAFVYISKSKLDEFNNLGFEAEILTPPSMLLPKWQLDKNPRGTSDLDYYPNYQQYIDMMNQFATDYPDLCELVTIGQSIEGRDILALHISDNIGEDAAEPEFFYTSSMHGDELTGYPLMLRLIDYLLSNYNTDNQVNNLVSNIDIWINPLANPDGTFAGGDGSVFGATRYNANGIDINRNFPDPEDGQHPDGNAWQQETQAFMDFAEAHDFVMSANFHGGEEVVNYPWDTWSTLAADDDWWYFVSRQFADTIHEYAPASYFSGFDNGVTNGYQWYSISGGRQDYMNYFQHCREVTIELSSVKLPPASQITSFWDYDYRSLLNYMEQVLYGVRGNVTNALTNVPIKAKVFTDNHDIDESHVYASMPLGNYNRLLKSGIYSLTFSAFGYFDQTISPVSVNDFNTTILDVQLEPYVGFVENHEIQVNMYPNPASDKVNLEFSDDSERIIKVFDINSRLVKRFVLKGKEVVLNLSDLRPAKYFISIEDHKNQSKIVTLVLDK